MRMVDAPAANLHRRIEQRAGKLALVSAGLEGVKGAQLKDQPASMVRTARFGRNVSRSGEPPQPSERCQGPVERDDSGQMVAKLDSPGGCSGLIHVEAQHSKPVAQAAMQQRPVRKASHERMTKVHKIVLLPASLGRAAEDGGMAGAAPYRPRVRNTEIRILKPDEPPVARSAAAVDEGRPIGRIAPQPFPADERPVGMSQGRVSFAVLPVGKGRTRHNPPGSLAVRKGILPVRHGSCSSPARRE